MLEFWHSIAKKEAEDRSVPSSFSEKDPQRGALENGGTAPPAKDEAPAARRKTAA